LHIVFCKWWT